MIDKRGRNIDYLRVSLTDRCNLRCVYCMPEEGIQKKCHDEILRFEEIERIIMACASIGIKNRGDPCCPHTFAGYGNRRIQ